MGKRIRKSKQCLPSRHGLPRHIIYDLLCQPSTNNPLILLYNLQLPLHLYASGPRVVPLRSTSLHPSCHISRTRPALHILVTNALHLRHSSNDSQWSSPLANLPIPIPRGSRLTGPIRARRSNSVFCCWVLLYCHRFRAHTGHSCPAHRRRDGV